MASLNMQRTASRLVATAVSRPLAACQVRAAASRLSRRHLSTGIRIPVIAASRPQPTKTQRSVPSGARTIFIQTESTPNPDALKFLPNHRIIPPDMSTPFIEYLNPRSTISPPHPSPLAAKLMNIDGVTSVFYGTDFITVTKAGDANWAHIRPEIFALITEAITSGEKIVNVVERKADEAGQAAAEEDSLAYNENDSEVVGMIKELLETRIRPAIQEDGGDIEFRGFEDGQVLLKLRGACRTCDSSTVTLKNGIEGMLMHYTKNAAELCALLVSDLYGELPSRILAALFTKGRSTIAQLGLYTQLGPRQIRNGLGVLIQQNLLYHHTNPDTKRTTYDANPDACYNLVRFGKILEMIESQYGTAERDLVQTLLLLGYARIAELTHAYVSRAPTSNGHANGNGVNGAGSGLIQSESELHSVLSHLIRCDIIETVRPQSFRDPNDVYREIEAEVTKTAPGEKASKTKIDQQRQIMEQYRSFIEQPKALKRQLDQFGGPVTKRRKLGNGFGEEDRAMDDDLPPLNPNVVVRVNYEKCLVELRSHRLAAFAKDTLGEVTGEVYRTLLGLLTSEVSRCRPDPFLGEDSIQQQAAATTMDVYEHLDESINVAAGIGKAPKDKIDYQSAEKIRTAPAGNDMITEDSDEEPSGPFDSDDDSDEGGKVGSFSRRSRSVSKPNGGRPMKVTFEDTATSSDNRLDQMRQHLLLLAESKHRFVRHCGTQGRGQWTVDFDQVMERLRELELDGFIEQSFGRHGLRLTRILREKGKLDEKMLPSAALMKKTDVQAKMLAMQMAGLVDIQEVPKDNTRLANRTLFFWFFDRERYQAHILDDLYKAMVRALQVLQVERHRERNILSFVERKDVMGKEEEVMTAEHYNKYNRHLEEQNKLIGQVMRLDEMVSIFRDY